MGASKANGGGGVHEYDQEYNVMYSWCIFVATFLRVPIVLVGNKRDLHMQRVVTFEMGKKLANEWNVSFIESSAKQNEVSYMYMYNIPTHILSIMIFMSHLHVGGWCRERSRGRNELLNLPPLLLGLGLPEQAMGWLPLRFGIGNRR